MTGAITDVARLAGVSKATASRALSGNGQVATATRDRVLEAASRIGYVPSPLAASLTTGRTKTIVLASPFASRWYFGEMLEGIEAALLNRDFDLTLYNVHPELADRQRLFEYFLARKRPDGLIAIDIRADSTEQGHLSALDRPIVAVGGNIRAAYTLDIDDFDLGYRATRHLIELGHRQIAHVASVNADREADSWSGRRLGGYLGALSAAGLWTRVHVLPAVHSLPAGHEAAMHLLPDPASRPTAVFAATDEIAIGVILAARALNLDVPGDLSVIGIDGHEYAEMFSLTTFEQHPDRQGRRAAEIMVERVLQGTVGDSGSRERWATPLTVRSTTAPPR